MLDSTSQACYKNHMGHFLFTIYEKSGKLRQCLLQGNGGLRGAGSLGLQNKTKKALQCAREECLRGARQELRKEGTLREFCGEDLHYSQRIKKISPEAVLEVEFVGEW